MIFLNLSNHPSEGWSEEQLYNLTLSNNHMVYYSLLRDFPFFSFENSLPFFNIISMVNNLADDTVSTITALGKDIVVHIMGEMTFTFAVVSRLKAMNIKCVASTTERNTVITPDGKKISEFKFVQFREY